MGGFLKQYLWLVNAVVILICSYFTAKIINVYIAKGLEVRRTIGVMKKPEPAAPFKEMHPRNYYNVILERNIFDSTDAIGSCETDEDCAENEACRDGVCVRKAGTVASSDGKPVKTRLPLKLQAVLVVGDGKDKRSSATIEMNNKTDVYAVRGDETFAPGVVLLQVMRDRIIFSNAGRLEFAELFEEGMTSIFAPPGNLAMKTPAPSRTDTDSSVMTEGGKVIIDQREIDSALANLNQLYTEIRIIPNLVDGKMDGFKILSVKPGSIFAKLGLKRGDILSRINGIQLDVKSGFDTFNQLKDQKNFTLDLNRGGENRTIDYEIR